MTKYSYKLAKVGLGKLLFSAFLALVMTIVFIYSASEMTPKSVSVSGYTRSDGTHVQSYSRRPSGGAQHDAPFEIFMYISGVGTLFFGFIFVSKIKEFKEFDIENDFRQNFTFSNEFPILEISSKDIPTISVKPKKEWRCDSCKSTINTGSIYYYYSRENNSNHSHICNNCRISFINHNEIYLLKKKQYEIEYNKIKELRKYEIELAYYQLFGEKPNKIT